MNKHFIATVVGAGLLMAGAAQADPFVATFTDTISVANTPGITVGDTFTARLVLDNGGNSLISQDWNLSQTNGFTIDAGTYHATYSTVFSNFDFQTDGSGKVSLANFFGTDPSSSNSDNFGTFIGDFVDGGANFTDSLGRQNSIAAGGFTTIGEWTIAPETIAASVPEPGTLALFAGSLIGLGVIRRRKHS
jgi:hypothetical protein